MGNNTQDAVRLAFWDLEPELAQTRRVLEAIPEGKMDYRPHPKAWSLGGLAHHLAQLPFLFTMAARSTGFDFATAERVPESKSVADLLELFDATAAGAREALAGLTADSLGDDWTFRMGERVFFTRPRAETLRHFAISHMIHHRAQLTIYLRQLDARVPGMYGPTADDV